MKRCHGRLHYDRKFQIFIFLIGYINKGVFCFIISYLRIKSYNVLNYNNCSTDWSFPLSIITCVRVSSFLLTSEVLRLVYPMLPLSLDCPCLIAPSIFSNVYFNIITERLTRLFYLTY